MASKKKGALTILAVFSLCHMSLSMSGREDAERNSDLIDKKFEKIQEDFNSGNIQFLGGEPTFKIKANPILAYDLDEITGDLEPNETDDDAEHSAKQIQK